MICSGRKQCGEIAPIEGAVVEARDMHFDVAQSRAVSDGEVRTRREVKEPRFGGRYVRRVQWSR